MRDNQLWERGNASIDRFLIEEIESYNQKSCHICKKIFHDVDASHDNNEDNDNSNDDSNDRKLMSERLKAMLWDLMMLIITTINIMMIVMMMNLMPETLIMLIMIMMVVIMRNSMLWDFILSVISMK